MAKRHHSSERAMHREHKIHGGHYEGMDPRRRQEMEDAGMISEDHGAIANLPQGVIMKPYGYAGSGGGMSENLDDTISGIDNQMSLDNRKRMEHFQPKKV